MNVIIYMYTATVKGDFCQIVLYSTDLEPRHAFVACCTYMIRKQTVYVIVLKM